MDAKYVQYDATDAARRRWGIAAGSVSVNLFELLAVMGAGRDTLWIIHTGEPVDVSGAIIHTRAASGMIVV